MVEIKEGMGAIIASYKAWVLEGKFLLCDLDTRTGTLLMTDGYGLDKTRAAVFHELVHMGLLKQVYLNPPKFIVTAKTKALRQRRR